MQVQVQWKSELEAIANYLDKNEAATMAMQMKELLQRGEVLQQQQAGLRMLLSR